MASQGGPGPLMRRPGYGTRGKAVIIRTNAFSVKAPLPEFIVHHYDVTIRPEVPTRVNRKVFDFIDKDGGFKGVAAVYDGQKNCYAPKKLDFTGDQNTFEIVLPEDENEEKPARKREGEGRNFRVTFRKVAEVNLYELSMIVSQGAGEKAFTENCLQAIAVLNIMVRHAPSISNISKAASIYPPPPKGQRGYEISGGLELWRGYFSSIRPAPKKLIVNVDATMLPLVKPGNLVEVSAAFLRVHPNQLASLPDRERIQLSRFLRGVKVTVNRNDPKTPRMHFKIKDVSRQSAAALSFEDENGRKTTVAQYFKNVHAVNLRGANFPCVQLTKKSFYPMELCSVAQGNKFSKKLDPDQVAEALKFTTNSPKDRIDQVREGLRILGYSENPICKAWGFSIDPNPIEFQARVLDPPTLNCKDMNGKDVKLRSQAGTFDLRGKRFFQPAPPVKQWGVIIFEDANRFSNEQAKSALEMLSKACGELGLHLPMSPLPTLVRKHSRDENVIGAFRDLLTLSKGVKPALVVCFIPQKNNQYALIKQFGDLQKGGGVATQCLNLGKLRKLNMSYFSNVALKVNIKLRGVNVRVDPQDLPGFQQMPTIVFGADVTHPGPASLAPSIAAVVGSWDAFAANYQAETRIQSSREEIIQDLQPMVIALLKVFYEKNNKKPPARIVFYRDGVSEGQYAQVYEKEVKAIRAACASISPTYKPPITYVICAKRHHFRFFPKDPNDQDRTGNARAGTVVDTTITHPTDNDFFLQSHASLLGTSRPTHYACLLDENKFGPDNLQRTTYALTYAYARCTRSVSIVAPAYFSHQVATRARFHLGTAADDLLEASTNISGRASDDISRARDERLAQVRDMLQPIHVNLKDTLYFL